MKYVLLSILSVLIVLMNYDDTFMTTESDSDVGNTLIREYIITKAEIKGVCYVTLRST